MTLTAETRPGESPFYIAATTGTPPYRARTLKQGDTFIVVDPHGDMQAFGTAAEGLFHNDTRYLSRLLLVLEGARPLLLSSSVTEDNTVVVADLTNPDMYQDGRLVLARDTLHILRSKVLGQGVCLEAMQIRNYGHDPIQLRLRIGYAADFADIFEVRGQVRTARGELEKPVQLDDRVTLGYRGLDGVVRRTCLAFDPQPDEWVLDGANYQLSLAQGEMSTIFISVRCETGTPIRGLPPGYAERLETTRLERRQSIARAVRFHSSNVAFNHWLNRSQADLEMLVTHTPQGPFPYAGIPWFSTAFGRDALITALQCLWLDPDMAKGTLAFLAANQATRIDRFADAEPGKILHETRKGEMAVLGEVPFGKYYGSIDSTPLFIILAAAYWKRTADTPFIRAIWPNIEAALEWMATYGDIDGDGFLEYDRQSVNGLINQGWKDSSDSVFHADGQLAEAPIALCEVQAYAYAAYDGAAELARAIDRSDRVGELHARAEALRTRFEQVFWCEDIGTYALALDGRKRPCRVRSSNAGQALFGGIASPERAARVAELLLQPEFFPGWGIRTIAEGEARYNPMSYHNGSVWPHDNGLIALGFARYGLRAPLLRLLTGLFDVSMQVDLNRMPELFCGFARRQGEGPTAYPVACTPQAWAAGSVFALLGAVLGVGFEPSVGRIRFDRPTLPGWLDEIRLENLRLGSGAVDLLFRRQLGDTAFSLLAKSGEVEVIMSA
jgi:glycogen debranching enzyme